MMLANLLQNHLKGKKPEKPKSRSYFYVSEARRRPYEIYKGMLLKQRCPPRIRGLVFLKNRYYGIYFQFHKYLYISFTYVIHMREQFIAKVWIVGGAFVVNIPKKIVNLFKIKKGEHYRVTLESIKK